MRPLWQGAISFGLILIPVKMYKATKERNLDFHLVREGDLCPIRYARVCKSTGEEVPYDKIAKSYEYQKGDQVIFHDEDFKKFYSKRTETIEVTEFVNEAEIDIKYYEQPYFLEPEKGADKVYALLREALKKSKKVGIAKYVLHNLEHLGVIKPEDDILMLNQIRFDSEIRKPIDLKIPASKKFSEKELDTAILLIDQLSEAFKPGKFKDTYTDELKVAISKKSKSKTVNAPKSKIVKDKPAEVVDLLGKLRKSLQDAKTGQQKTMRKKTASSK